MLMAGISPVTLALVAGAGVLATGATGSLLLGFAAGIAVWVGRVALSRQIAKRIAALPRRIDPFALKEPWRFFVRDAVAARNRFAEALQRAEEGPLTDRLVEIGEAINHGVEQCWEAAQRGQQLSEARSKIGIDRVRRELDRTGADDPRRAGLMAQAESYDRIDQQEQQALTELERLDVRLDESVARVTELGTRAGGSLDIAELEASITDVVQSLEALRLGLDDVEGRS